ncbi:hypothetical protein TNCV_1919351 [Trichonephila clavipes]|nr:hypothetical protein TNCV_1919351 [Trichonephila clavipes]
MKNPLSDDLWLVEIEEGMAGSLPPGITLVVFNRCAARLLQSEVSPTAWLVTMMFCQQKHTKQISTAQSHIQQYPLNCVLRNTCTCILLGGQLRHCQVSSLLYQAEQSRTSPFKMFSLWEVETLNEILDHPRQYAIAAFRLETWHNYDVGYLRKLKVLPSPNCVLCGDNSPNNAEPLEICPVVSDNIYDRYWKTREQLQALQSD